VNTTAPVADGWRRHEGDLQNPGLVWEIVPRNCTHVSYHPILPADKIGVWLLMRNLDDRKRRCVSCYSPDDQDDSQRKQPAHSQRHPLGKANQYPETRLHSWGDDSMLRTPRQNDSSGSTDHGGRSPLPTFLITPWGRHRPSGDGAPPVFKAHRISLSLAANWQNPSVT